MAEEAFQDGVAWLCLRVALWSPHKEGSLDLIPVTLFHYFLLLLSLPISGLRILDQQNQSSLKSIFL